MKKTYHVTYTLTLEVRAKDEEAANYAAWDELEKMTAEDIKDLLNVDYTEELTA